MNTLYNLKINSHIQLVLAFVLIAFSSKAQAQFDYLKVLENDSDKYSEKVVREVFTNIEFKDENNIRKALTQASKKYKKNQISSDYRVDFLNQIALATDNKATDAIRVKKYGSSAYRQNILNAQSMMFECLRETLDIMEISNELYAEYLKAFETLQIIKKNNLNNPLLRTFIQKAWYETWSKAVWGLSSQEENRVLKLLSEKVDLLKQLEQSFEANADFKIIRSTIKDFMKVYSDPQAKRIVRDLDVSTGIEFDLAIAKQAQKHLDAILNDIANTALQERYKSILSNHFSETEIKTIFETLLKQGRFNAWFKLFNNSSNETYIIDALIQYLANSKDQTGIKFSQTLSDYRESLRVAQMADFFNRLSDIEKERLHDYLDDIEGSRQRRIGEGAWTDRDWILLNLIEIVSAQKVIEVLSLDLGRVDFLEFVFDETAINKSRKLKEIRNQIATLLAAEGIDKRNALTAAVEQDRETEQVVLNEVELRESERVFNTAEQLYNILNVEAQENSKEKLWESLHIGFSEEHMQNLLQRCMEVGKIKVFLSHWDHLDASSIRNLWLDILRSDVVVWRDYIQTLNIQIKVQKTIEAEKKFNAWKKSIESKLNNTNFKHNWDLVFGVSINKQSQWALLESIYGSYSSRTWENFVEEGMILQARRWIIRRSFNDTTVRTSRGQLIQLQFQNEQSSARNEFEKARDLISGNAILEARMLSFRALLLQLQAMDVLPTNIDSALTQNDDTLRILRAYIDRWVKIDMHSDAVRYVLTGDTEALLPLLLVNNNQWQNRAAQFANSTQFKRFIDDMIELEETREVTSERESTTRMARSHIFKDFNEIEKSWLYTWLLRQGLDWRFVIALLSGDDEAARRMCIRSLSQVRNPSQTLQNVLEKLRLQRQGKAKLAAKEFKQSIELNTALTDKRINVFAWGINETQIELILEELSKRALLEQFQAKLLSDETPEAVRQWIKARLIRSTTEGVREAITRMDMEVDVNLGEVKETTSGTKQPILDIDIETITASDNEVRQWHENVEGKSPFFDLRTDEEKIKWFQKHLNEYNSVVKNAKIKKWLGKELSFVEEMLINSKAEEVIGRSNYSGKNGNLKNTNFVENYFGYTFPSIHPLADLAKKNKSTFTELLLNLDNPFNRGINATDIEKKDWLSNKIIFFNKVVRKAKKKHWLGMQLNTVEEKLIKIEASEIVNMSSYAGSQDVKENKPYIEAFYGGEVFPSWTAIRKLSKSSGVSFSEICGNDNPFVSGVNVSNLDKENWLKEKIKKYNSMVRQAKRNFWLGVELNSIEKKIIEIKAEEIRSITSYSGGKSVPENRSHLEGFLGYSITSRGSIQTLAVKLQKPISDIFGVTDPFREGNNETADSKRIWFSERLKLYNHFVKVSKLKLWLEYSNLSELEKKLLEVNASEIYGKITYDESRNGVIGNKNYLEGLFGQNFPSTGKLNKQIFTPLTLNFNALTESENPFLLGANASFKEKIEWIHRIIFEYNAILETTKRKDKKNLSLIELKLVEVNAERISDRSKYRKNYTYISKLFSEHIPSEATLTRLLVQNKDLGIDFEDLILGNFEKTPKPKFDFKIKLKRWKKFLTVDFDTILNLETEKPFTQLIKSIEKKSESKPDSNKSETSAKQDGKKAAAIETSPGKKAQGADFEKKIAIQREFIIDGNTKVVGVDVFDPDKANPNPLENEFKNESLEFKREWLVRRVHEFNRAIHKAQLKDLVLGFDSLSPIEEKLVARDVKGEYIVTNITSNGAFMPNKRAILRQYFNHDFPSNDTIYKLAKKFSMKITELLELKDPFAKAAYKNKVQLENKIKEQSKNALEHLAIRILQYNALIEMLEQKISDNKNLNDFEKMLRKMFSNFNNEKDAYEYKKIKIEKNYNDRGGNIKNIKNELLYKRLSLLFGEDFPSRAKIHSKETSYINTLKSLGEKFTYHDFYKLELPGQMIVEENGELKWNFDPSNERFNLDFLQDMGFEIDTDAWKKAIDEGYKLQEDIVKAKYHAYHWVVEHNEVIERKIVREGVLVGEVGKDLFDASIAEHVNLYDLLPDNKNIKRNLLALRVQEFNQAIYRARLKELLQGQGKLTALEKALVKRKPASNDYAIVYITSSTSFQDKNIQIALRQYFNHDFPSANTVVKLANDAFNLSVTELLKVKNPFFMQTKNYKTKEQSRQALERLVLRIKQYNALLSFIDNKDEKKLSFFEQKIKAEFFNASEPFKVKSANIYKKSKIKNILSQLFPESFPSLNKIIGQESSYANKLNEGIERVENKVTSKQIFTEHRLPWSYSLEELVDLSFLPEEYFELKLDWLGAIALEYPEFKEQVAIEIAKLKVDEKNKKTRKSSGNSGDLTVQILPIKPIINGAKLFYKYGAKAIAYAKEKFGYVESNVHSGVIGIAADVSTEAEMPIKEQTEQVIAEKDGSENSGERPVSSESFNLGAFGEPKGYRNDLLRHLPAVAQTNIKNEYMRLLWQSDSASRRIAELNKDNKTVDKRLKAMRISEETAFHLAVQKGYGLYRISELAEPYKYYDTNKNETLLKAIESLREEFRKEFIKRLDIDRYIADHGKNLVHSQIHFICGLFVIQAIDLVVNQGYRMDEAFSLAFTQILEANHLKSLGVFVGISTGSSMIGDFAIKTYVVKTDALRIDSPLVKAGLFAVSTVGLYGAMIGQRLYLKHKQAAKSIEQEVVNNMPYDIAYLMSDEIYMHQGEEDDQMIPGVFPGVYSHKAMEELLKDKKEKSKIGKSIDLSHAAILNDINDCLKLARPKEMFMQSSQKRWGLMWGMMLGNKIHWNKDLNLSQDMRHSMDICHAVKMQFKLQMSSGNVFRSTQLHLPHVQFFNTLISTGLLMGSGQASRVGMGAIGISGSGFLPGVTATVLTLSLMGVLEKHYHEFRYGIDDEISYRIYLDHLGNQMQKARDSMDDWDEAVGYKEDKMLDGFFMLKLEKLIEENKVLHLEFLEEYTQLSMKVMNQMKHLDEDIQSKLFAMDSAQRRSLDGMSPEQQNKTDKMQNVQTRQKELLKNYYADLKKIGAYIEKNSRLYGGSPEYDIESVQELHWNLKALKRYEEQITELIVIDQATLSRSMERWLLGDYKLRAQCLETKSKDQSNIRKECLRHAEVIRRSMRSWLNKNYLEMGHYSMSWKLQEQLLNQTKDKLENIRGEDRSEDIFIAYHMLDYMVQDEDSKEQVIKMLMGAGEATEYLDDCGGDCETLEELQAHLKLKEEKEEMLKSLQLQTAEAMKLEIETLNAEIKALEAKATAVETVPIAANESLNEEALEIDYEAEIELDAEEQKLDAELEFDTEEEQGEPQNGDMSTIERPKKNDIVDFKTFFNEEDDEVQYAGNRRYTNQTSQEQEQGQDELLLKQVEIDTSQYTSGIVTLDLHDDYPAKNVRLKIISANADLEKKAPLFDQKVTLNTEDNFLIIELNKGKINPLAETLWISIENKHQPQYNINTSAHLQ